MLLLAPCLANRCIARNLTLLTRRITDQFPRCPPREGALVPRASLHVMQSQCRWWAQEHLDRCAIKPSRRCACAGPIGPLPC
eukprot:scaffold115206_cov31-Tisochrysis_lutea.AAC.1